MPAGALPARHTDSGGRCLQIVRGFGNFPTDWSAARSIADGVDDRAESDHQWGWRQSRRSNISKPRLRSRAITASGWRSHSSIWRTGRPAASIFRRTIVARLAVHRAGTAPGSRIARSERVSGRDQSQARASFGSITIRSPGSFAPLTRFASFN